MAMLRCAWSAILLLAASAAAELQSLPSDTAFEDEVLMSPNCWAVLFTSSTRDVKDATTLVERLGGVLPGLSLASADVDNVKAVCSEFNVRKRMVPRLLVFNSRARQPIIIKLKSDTGEARSLDEVCAARSARLVAAH
jgi:hypothetical protein